MLPPPDDYAKEPPAVPPQLLLTLLNAPPNADAPSLLPRPQVCRMSHIIRHNWFLRAPPLIPQQVRGIIEAGQ
jgi:hypothetical protein